jgi:hypothetical protein
LSMPWGSSIIAAVRRLMDCALGGPAPAFSLAWAGFPYTPSPTQAKGGMLAGMSVDYRQLLKDVIRGELLDHGAVTSPLYPPDAAADRAVYRAYVELVGEVLSEQGQVGRPFQIWADRRWLSQP